MVPEPCFRVPSHSAVALADRTWRRMVERAAVRTENIGAGSCEGGGRINGLLGGEIRPSVWKPASSLSGRPPLLSYKTQTSTSWGVKSAIARFVNHLFNFSSFYLNTPLQRNGLAQTIEIPTKRHEFVVAGPEISIIRACFPFWR